MSTGATAVAGRSSTQDDEWFGEGSAFDSGEDLAAALFALAGVEPRAVPPAPEVTVAVAPVTDPGSTFLEVQRPNAVDAARRPYSTPARPSSPSASSGRWS